ncbi:putative iron-regulated membrane protein [Nocardiopsis sp. Huas11]|uniref:PepSY-associated TM helix domain-containing protein n=1 Tax=Nocardiopsis sp. Huas11 TaxID=2183912 RepID=UPI000EB3A88D|nr:PepSY-associated TM helix domain-containing protein [Nocardiopsis sp. Huas11]RKS06742.1 putative iron-regulated membrane protein [Nocardiopsis sp. Huas11]
MSTHTPEHPEPPSAEDRTDAPAPGAAAPRTGARPTWSALRHLLLRLHFYAGILVAPFVVVAALTGLVYIYTPQLEQALYAEQLRVEPGDGAVSLERQAAAAAEAHPDARLSAVRPAEAPDESTRVLMSADGLPDGHLLAVFVDPHDGAVLGDLTSYGSSSSLPVRSWLAELHRSLHLGDAGRLYSELAASWLWVVALGGVILWTARRRREHRLRRTLLPDASATGRARTMSWHGSVGVWALAGLALITATGLTWSQYAGGNITQIRAALDWQTPALSTAAVIDHHGHSGHGDHAGHGAPATDLDAALAAARSAGLDGPVEIGVPQEDGAPYTVAQTVRGWPVQQDQVAVDPADGTVVEELRFDDFPLMAKLSNWGIGFHMGLLFGLPNQLLLTALALSVAAMVFWGYRMWWQRRPTRGGAFAWGRPVPRGAGHDLPWWCVALVAACAVGVGVLLPVLGVSLLCFLAVDAALGLHHRRRGRPHASATPPST